MEKKCKNHGITEFSLNSQNRYVCKKCRSEKVVIARSRRRKRIFTEFKINGCSNCGYNKCMAALEFHHLNPKDKDPNFSKIMNKSLDYIKEEYKKCIVLCSNCHREEHERIRNEKKSK